MDNKAAAFFRKIHTFGQSLFTDPLTAKKAFVLCLYVEGVWAASLFLLTRLHISFRLLSDIAYLVTVLVIARGMGKDELRRIFAWRNVPLPVFAGILIMFYGMDILRLELSNLLQIALPVPEGFFNDSIFRSNNVFLIIVAGALFPGFSEEVFFRGIITRRFFRSCSPKKAILLSAALFGIFHFNPWQMTNAFLGGIFYGWIYWRYRSIWLTIFTHTYHNILVSFMPRPYVRVENYSGYQLLWRHPLWFDIMGLALFAFGLLTLIVLSRKTDAKGG